MSITADKKAAQLDRFREAAREVGADEADDALDRVMGRLDLKKKTEDDDEKKGVGGFEPPTPRTSI